ncbi:MAG: hypothetical protein ACKVP0_25650 [Pirellulaceae bacterium]
MNAFTVSWAPDAERHLATLYADNFLIRKDISEASDLLESVLAKVPLSLGIAVKDNIRNVVHPPLSLLYKVSLQDRKVEVLWVKFWDE